MREEKQMLFVASGSGHQIEPPEPAICNRLGGRGIGTTRARALALRGVWHWCCWKQRYGFNSDCVYD